MSSSDNNFVIPNITPSINTNSADSKAATPELVGAVLKKNESSMDILQTTQATRLNTNMSESKSNNML